MSMDKCRQNPPKIQTSCCSEEVSKIDWEGMNMTEEEEDIICRMHRLVGDKWALIAGRVPGRKAEEIERFWLLKNRENLKEQKDRSKRVEQKRRQNL